MEVGVSYFFRQHQAVMFAAPGFPEFFKSFFP
jgi:hypothetical protein